MSLVKCLQNWYTHDMTLPTDLPVHKLQFYVTTPYTCGYLPGKMAQSLIATPQHLVTAPVYNGLIQQGFRRSGKFSYRPHCENCRACIPVRLVLADFLPSRSQKRAFKQNADLTAHVVPVHFSEAHFALYQTYQIARHSPAEGAENSETKDEAEQYRQFLCTSNVESLMIEFCDANGALKIVSVIDILNDGISAVYTFYDTTETKASFGTFSIMWLANWAKAANLDYLYLGYWIEKSQKMSYKQAFKPQQKLIDGEWI